MGDIDPIAALELAVELASWAGSVMTSSSRARPTHQKDNPADIVTDTDLLIEKEVRRRIARACPDHAVDGEEYGAPSHAVRYTWHLDPIDGTTNFASGLPWSSFSLALADAGRPVVGVVADPHRNELFTAVRGRGAFLNGHPASCSEVSELAGGVVLTEWNGHRAWPGMSEVLNRLAEEFATVRIMGSSALALASAGIGRARGALIGTYHPADDMAGVLIATEAGAVVRGRHGADGPGPMGVLVAAPGVAEQLARLWD